VLASGGRPELLTFHLDDDYGWDDGLICGGRMTILADPLPGGDDYHARYARLVEAGQGCVEAILLADADGAPAGSRYLFDAAGRFVANRGPSREVPAAVLRYLPDLAQRPAAASQHGVAYLPTLPRVTLFIVGGGHVGQAVAQLAAQCDFDIDVLDDRQAYVGPDRFPTAKRRLVGDVGRTLAEVAPALGPHHYALIVTRGHRHDEEALSHLAATKAGYVGMIGSKRKIRMIFEDLLAAGVPAEALHNVHAPLGLDIGSRTVPEIAVSIVAELIAHRNLGASEPRTRARVRVGAKEAS
jgi:xanthine dehydrogenase accessory factor